MQNFITRVTRHRRKASRKTVKTTTPNREYAEEINKVRGKMTENQIDKTLKDTFPASDPPAWY